MEPTGLDVKWSWWDHTAFLPLEWLLRPLSGSLGSLPPPHPHTPQPTLAVGDRTLVAHKVVTPKNSSRPSMGGGACTVVLD